MIVFPASLNFIATGFTLKYFKRTALVSVKNNYSVERLDVAKKLGATQVLHIFLIDT